jgi:hypothetical protein
MNHAGFDIHARNRASTRYGRASRADLVPPQTIDCPFCGKPTTASEGRIAQHIERGGFTLCPGGGVQPYIAAERAASLTADYKLPCESVIE